MNNTRRKFLASISMLSASFSFPIDAFSFYKKKKLKIVLVGTGIRGTSFWGRRLVKQYSEILEFVGLCDTNKGRLKYAQNFIGVNCKTYMDFDIMLNEQKPDLVIVCTVDNTHHEFIIKGLKSGIDVLTEKPLTTDEFKAQSILNAEKESGKKLIVGFNYRWSPYTTEIKKLLMKNIIGDITSVDFHWYLNTYHGASYFRRWHGYKEKGGSLWLHKATHHFDLLNWWLSSDPEEVFAYGSLEHYGSNGKFRGKNCRDCEFTKKCDYYFDITKDKRLVDLYVKNEKHDGYIRDNCLFREDIDIYDKMSAQIKYKNDIIVNYSLTTYSPFEGWRIAFNGSKGRIEASLDIPYEKDSKISQEEMHEKEMSQQLIEETSKENIIVHKLWSNFNKYEISTKKGGHGGGDELLHESIFNDSIKSDQFERSAGLRDGLMSILIGIAARKSIDANRPVRIDDLIKF